MSKSKNPTGYIVGSLQKFKFSLLLIAFLSLLQNGLVLIFPLLNAEIIDRTINESLEVIPNFDISDTLILYAIGIIIIFILGIVLVIYSNSIAEKYAAQVRSDIVNAASNQSFTSIQNITVQKLLTNVTSDVDAVKLLISQGTTILFSSGILLIGSIVLLLSINLFLGSLVVISIPILLVVFLVIFSRISKLFKVSQEIIDSLNRIVNETITGASLIRVLKSYSFENKKFEVSNTESRNVGFKILTGFAILIPFINFVSNLTLLVVIGFGGNEVINETLTPGDFTAFFNYVGLFIIPIITIGFLSSIFTRAFASFTRILEVIEAKSTESKGNVNKEIKGHIQFNSVTLELGNRTVIKDLSFEIKPGTRCAIIGPTAAGKTQIFYMLAGLLKQNNGDIKIDKADIETFSPASFYSQVGLVFQDSIMFNTTLEENITFSDNAEKEHLDIALETAELTDFIDTLESGLNTEVAEFGSTLSGGQKQRVTLARALAINPAILLLDDFTARVDIKTERKIFNNLQKNFANLTTISITQKIDSIKDFDQILLIMSGELVASGTHKELMQNSFEYRQIYESQQTAD